MQTPKSRNVTVEVPQRTSPTAPKTARKLKTPGSDAPTRTPKERSPKVVVRRSPRSPALEKKNPTRDSDLETQFAQLQEELKKVKDQLNSSESLKRRAQLEAEEAKKQLKAMSDQLEESEKQLLELSDSEEARILELRKLSQDRDRAWESELEAVQKQNEFNSAALASAMNEIQKLKIQLDRVADSEAKQARHAESANAEIQSLRGELMETLTLVEQMKNQLNDSKESEACALEEVSKAQMQLEAAKMTEDTLRSEGLKAMEACRSLSLELEQSINRVATLEELVSELQSAHQGIENTKENGANLEAEELKTELSNLQVEVSQLRAALEVSETRYQEEYIQSTLQIRSAYELVEQSKSESIRKEAEWKAKLDAAKVDLEELKEKLMSKEATLRNISDENKDAIVVVRESESTLADMRARLFDKEMELQNIKEENETLKSEMKMRETEGCKVNDETLALAEAARIAEKEALMKLGHLTEEADNSIRKAARVTEQLDAAQNANSEMEAELRRLKVQSDQWRKAAEAAAAILSSGNNGKYVDSPLSEDTDDDSPKKKNGNMLKKIGVLLKKGQK
ncbi:interactor of constitutive active ROPs 2, chloroplastic-like [Lycium barbarum]|uniref:interactor of constitutive active ROPs 2, chloroplastic-like n=1 Tax=Lycium barbarum TaxID=112863 RepID=UPI00293E414F|nr:interactor of constitutive active ROPs 2, chloroplastic-like [Lycium barbarum]XP_060176561.1 interactor of constitutive active ROPs 2, chloroplastic-like [Lycium barbarum]XP_060176562.1 interactor of constitutive active ROPs 2, chloroplastic-like [Lycium barbarum]XP_060176563.1 interactor of constitutive active ROPs 2, chloroplastic-like [Lycium barbarum]XP_060176564.1 interactor of constitutive active ROPs 2, chloroplastic-like [Lycium barbarum]